jgi:hypothetical protein
VIRSIKNAVRYNIIEPARYRWHRTQADWQRLLGHGKPHVSFLLATDGQAYTSDQQYAPIRRHATDLRQQLGVIVRFMRLAEAMELPRQAFAEFDVVGIKLGFRTPEVAAERIATTFRKRLGDTDSRLVYFDGDDDLCVQWPGVLRQADLYIKKHVFIDPAHYCRSYIGKSNLTDYVARRHGISFESDIIPASGVLTPAEARKVQLGWNIGFDDPIVALLSRLQPTPRKEKDYDIVCRATMPQGNWLAPLRQAALLALKNASHRWKILAPTHRVPQGQYYDELNRSRICVSPLGYGELCWRDFEAILCGCLVIKPDVSHLRTEPNIFVPHETYVPVQWDYSDLADSCDYYLAHESERARIASRAYDILLEHLRGDWFAKMFGTILDRLMLAGQDASTALA